MVAAKKGRPKSGRWWKAEGKRKSSLIGDKPLHTSWRKRVKQREEKKALKEYEQQLKEELQRQKEEKRKRIEEHRKRKEENERKAEVVQVITNTAKLKRLSKKQRKNIRKQ
ncbi:coiled-coil domain-containing protein 86-like [Corticium candelabrum]|uniref:coiled-coil domain-containing protein 86-like n=1 Tax=Corticium candelabrum TaxID=121492 RepID=UPI002E270E00|nr:coiled-coil domain-containing protein 86-like [Corticium candelabrum]